MMRHTKYFLIVIIVILYFIIKASLLYSGGKFGIAFSAFLMPLVFSVLAITFIFSCYILLKIKTNDLIGWIFLKSAIAVFLFVVGVYCVTLLYDTGPPYIKYYFKNLNNGAQYPRYADFRIEYFILFCFNFLSVFIFIYKILQSWLSRTSRR